MYPKENVLCWRQNRPSPFLQVNQAISSMKEDKIFATQLSLHRRQGFIALKEVMFKSSLIHVFFFREYSKYIILLIKYSCLLSFVILKFLKCLLRKQTPWLDVPINFRFDFFENLLSALTSPSWQDASDSRRFYAWDRFGDFACLSDSLPVLLHRKKFLGLGKRPETLVQRFSAKWLLIEPV